MKLLELRNKLNGPDDLEVEFMLEGQVLQFVDAYEATGSNDPDATERHVLVIELKSVEDVIDEKKS